MQTGEASVKSHLYDNGTLPILYSERHNQKELFSQDA